jgi:hypothetical protein
MGRSNFFANIENSYAQATKEQLEYNAIKEATNMIRGLYSVMSNADRITVPILFLGAKLGCAGDLTPAKKELADKVFGEIMSNPEMSKIYSVIGAPVGDADYSLVSIVAKMENDIAMPFLKYVFCFGYIDGKFEDEVANKLDGMFGMALLKDFFGQDPE